MSAGWVGGTVRARGLARRRLGRRAVAELAAGPDLATALGALGRSSYRRGLEPGSDLATAQRAVASTAVWHLRVLAGWLPPGGAEALRCVAGWYEIANIEDRLALLAGGRSPPPLRLGALATAWSRVADAPTPSAVRDGLAASVWGDPGSDEPGPAGVALRLAWARRLAGTVPGAVPWAAGQAALLLAGLEADEPAVGEAGPDGRLPARALSDARSMLGRGWEGAGTVPELASRLPRAAAWVLEEVASPADLWRAHLAWWNRVETEGLGAYPARPRPGPQAVVGVAMALVADAWRVAAALEVAARGGREDLVDVLG